MHNTVRVMGRLRAWSGNPVVLLLALLSGAFTGYFLPGQSAHYALMGQMYLAVVNMAALPFLVVATFFGLRQAASLPRPGWRLARLLGLSLGLMVVCGLVGLGAALLAQTGKNLSAGELQHLGQLVQKAADGASNVEVSLFAAETPTVDAASYAAGGLVMSNYFKALAQGHLLSILLGTLIFGAGVVMQAGEASRVLMGSFEAIYRSLEALISAANLFIPLLVFGMAALFAISVDGRSLLAMASFLWTFAAATLLLCSVALAIVWKRSGMPLGLVFSALKTPALISLSSTSPMAAIPDTIHAMSSRLGFSRGITEFIVPVASIFVRCGAALYFSILLVFVAHMYGHPLGVAEGLLICGGAMLGAFASAGHAGAASLLYIGVTLRILQLPLEAVVPLFLAIELLCAGPRNLLSFLLVSVLVALVSEGLPSEKRDFAETAHIESAQPIIFTFSTSEIAIVLLCVALVMLFITCAGVGYGMR